MISPELYVVQETLTFDILNQRGFRLRCLDNRKGGKVG